MGLGAAVRHRLGRWEPVAAEVYRSRFINLDDVARLVASIARPRRMLEIGCGEGAVAERMCRELPASSYVGIDICAAPGRLFGGDRLRAQFHRISSSDFLAQGPEPFDLVLMVDVFHHLPDDLRLPIVRDAGMLAAPGAMVVLKDWERSSGPATLASYIADRYVGGDPVIRYPSIDEPRNAIATGIPDAELACEARIPPRRNNVLLAVRRAGPGSESGQDPAQPVA